MNFTNATASDWNTARCRLERFCRAHDLDDNQAEEVAQACLTELLTHKWRDRCPASLAVAIRWRLHTARRYGVWTLAPGNTSRRRHAAAEAAPVRDTSPGWTDPARMAEAGESLAARMPRLAARARQEGTTPAGLALRACGWGWPADEQEPGTVPHVADIGPGYTVPRPIPAQPGDGSAIRTAPRTEPRPLEGEALAIYRERLAEFYATR